MTAAPRVGELDSARVLPPWRLQRGGVCRWWRNMTHCATAMRGAEAHRPRLIRCWARLLRRYEDRANAVWLCVYARGTMGTVFQSGQFWIMHGGARSVAAKARQVPYGAVHTREGGWQWLVEGFRC